MGEQVDARLNGGIAQLGEHLPCKQGVASSNLAVSTGFERSLSESEGFVLYLENRILKIISSIKYQSLQESKDLSRKR